MSETERRKSRNGYLGVLPEGWQYDVEIRHPETGRTIQVRPAGDPGGTEPEHEVLSEVAGDGVLRRATFPDLDAALRAAARHVKTLEAVREQEQAAAEARQAALLAFGETLDFTDREDGEQEASGDSG